MLGVHSVGNAKVWAKSWLLLAAPCVVSPVTTLGCPNSSILRIKMMLCRKLHCQKFFQLKSFWCKIRVLELKEP